MCDHDDGARPELRDFFLLDSLHVHDQQNH
jgi:hypothetical protein